MLLLHILQLQTEKTREVYHVNNPPIEN